jgi:hypothetical protein
MPFGVVHSDPSSAKGESRADCRRRGSGLAADGHVLPRAADEVLRGVGAVAEVILGTGDGTGRSRRSTGTRVPLNRCP